ncbi:PaaX family transcriptional regulator C-terminal domain-containing protein [Kitasatospora sp. NPDC088346]|uniref:PaaX family transcriptional regulator C-terminal domain-containing protein n=1 Tax=Kitasatospora sp. NPDC088346 TaxID=3364073 RepID=UPI0038072699
MPPTPPAVEIPTRVLVLGMVRADGTVDAGELYAAAGSLGMTDQQVRLCIKRLAAEGRLAQEGRGRRAVLRVTPDATGAIDPDLDLVAHAYLQDHGLAPWDGHWQLTAFAVPESARPARDALRAAVLRLGGAPLQGGLYVTANRIDREVAAEAERLGVPEAVTTLTTRDLRIGTETDPSALARRLWPLDDLAAGYHRLAAVAAARHDRLAGRTPTATEALTTAVELAAEFTRAMEPDPLLPPELLPRPWPGAHAREVFARCWSRLLEVRPPGSPALFAAYERVLGAD